MKPWQNGYELDYLKELESTFKPHNEQMISPFLEVKKNKIADALKSGHLVHEDHYRFIQRTSSRDTPIKIYSSRPEHLLAIKSKGDVEILYPVIEDVKAFESYVKGLGSSVWIFCSEGAGTLLSKIDGLSRVGAKYSSFGDCIFVFKYTAEAPSDDMFGVLESVETCLYTDPLERATAYQLKSYTFDVSSLVSKLGNMGFSNHYSNYNDGGWGAVALRGYSDDPMFITKPSEMNDKWHEKHPEMAEAQLRDTELYDQFPEVREMIASFAGDAPVHRVRIMRLERDKVIGQHTDLVDDDAGVALGKLPRFHIPLVSEDCEFLVWGMDGKESHRMLPGTLWYLDTRKPHSVINRGADRLHLVIDLETTPSLDKMMRSEL